MTDMQSYEQMCATIAAGLLDGHAGHDPKAVAKLACEIANEIRAKIASNG